MSGSRPRVTGITARKPAPEHTELDVRLLASGQELKAESQEHVQEAIRMALQVPVRLALKNVLFATDFGPVSEAALPFAVAIARRFESSIEAVHVFAFTELQMPPGK